MLLSLSEMARQGQASNVVSPCIAYETSQSYQQWYHWTNAADPKKVCSMPTHPSHAETCMLSTVLQQRSSACTHYRIRHQPLYQTPLHLRHPLPHIICTHTHTQQHGHIDTGHLKMFAHREQQVGQPTLLVALTQTQVSTDAGSHITCDDGCSLTWASFAGKITPQGRAPPPALHAAPSSPGTPPCCPRWLRWRPESSS